MTIDINIDKLTVLGGFSIPNGLNPGGLTTIEAIHDGSAAITIPEPATLALLGAALFGAGLTRRRKQ